MVNDAVPPSPVPLSMRVVARQTGLSPHVIRIWEKRHQAVSPSRTATNRRFYSPEDVERLILLKRATEAGHGIGAVARLSADQLASLLASGHGVGTSGTASANGAAEASPVMADTPDSLVEELFVAVMEMSPADLERLLDRGAVALGQIRVLNDVLVPLMVRIGEAWQSGQLKVAHEHVASAAIRSYLGQLSRPATLHPGAPSILVTTPAGQIHEVGASLAAAAAAQQGWRVVYAGAALPATEIAAAAIQNRVRAVALSIVYPSDDPALGPELLRLRRVLPPEVALLVGGRAAGGYRRELEEVRAVCVASLEAFLLELNRLRPG